VRRRCRRRPRMSATTFGGPTARKRALEDSKVRSGDRQGRTRCGLAKRPARAAAQVNHRNRRESVPFAAALKSP
jgi:hypothetical protein